MTIRSWPSEWKAKCHAKCKGDDDDAMWNNDVGKMSSKKWSLAIVDTESIKEIWRLKEIIVKKDARVNGNAKWVDLGWWQWSNNAF